MAQNRGRALARLVRRDPSWTACIVVALASSSIVLLAIAFALFSTGWWLVVPLAVVSAGLLVSAQYCFHRADRLNDQEHTCALGENDRREVRIANCDRAERVSLRRIRLALTATTVMVLLAVLVSIADASSRGDAVPWVELAGWMAVIAIVEHGTVTYIAPNHRFRKLLGL